MLARIAVGNPRNPPENENQENSWCNSFLIPARYWQEFRHTEFT